MSDSLLGRPWAQAPYELVTAPISAQAFRVAMAIQLHRSPSGRAPFPGQARLARMCHCSLATVERAVRELKEAGIIQTTPRRRNGGQHSTNEYELRVPAPSLTDDSRPSLTDEGAEVDSGVKQIFSLREKERGRRPQAGDPLWDALTEHFGAADTESARSNRGRVVRSLLGANATVEQLADAVEKYAKLMPPGTLCTENALEKWWGQLTQKRIVKAPCTECGIGGGVHLADCSKTAARKGGAVAH